MIEKGETGLRIVGVIPARYASIRLPAKPLVDLGGKPMIQRVYERATLAKSLGSVVVATDDERIAHVVGRFGGNVVMTSSEIQCGSDRVAAVAEQVDGDMYVNIQGDEPLIAPEAIDQATAVLLEDPVAPVGTLGKQIQASDELFNPSVVKVILDVNSYALYFSRAPIPFLRDETEKGNWPAQARFLKHMGIYVYRRKALEAFKSFGEGRLEKAEKLEQLRFLENGWRIKVGITEHESVPVDTSEDAERVRWILKQRASGD